MTGILRTIGEKICAGGVVEKPEIEILLKTSGLLNSEFEELALDWSKTLREIWMDRERLSVEFPNRRWVMQRHHNEIVGRDLAVPEEFIKEYFDKCIAAAPDEEWSPPGLLRPSPDPVLIHMGIHSENTNLTNASDGLPRLRQPDPVGPLALSSGVNPTLEIRTPQPDCIVLQRVDAEDPTQPGVIVVGGWWTEPLPLLWPPPIVTARHPKEPRLSLAQHFNELFKAAEQLNMQAAQQFRTWLMRLGLLAKPAEKEEVLPPFEVPDDL